jgi:CPA1 family monovalent cation:H+ antiporter
VGSGSWLLFRLLEMDVPGVYCFLFGALISPTDPIAVGGILRKAGVPDSLLIKITAESLFNDGMGVVLFILILEMATGGSGMGVSGADLGIHTLERSLWDVLALVGKEVGGGLVFGGLIGWIVYLMLARVDRYQVEILLTLAIVTGGYAAAQAFHMSGPLAMVVAGLLIGNHGRSLAMSTEVVERLDQFWELVDEFLNAVLFVLIGLEILLVDFNPTLVWAGLGAIPLVILARFLSAGIPVTILRRWRSFSPHAVKLLTWSGLKGGISVAMALSLPQGRLRDTLVSVTYVIVVFSIAIQGLTVGPLARRLSRDTASAVSE